MPRARHLRVLALRQRARRLSRRRAATTGSASICPRAPMQTRSGGCRGSSGFTARTGSDVRRLSASRPPGPAPRCSVVPRGSPWRAGHPARSGIQQVCRLRFAAASSSLALHPVEQDVGAGARPWPVNQRAIRGDGELRASRDRVRCHRVARGHGSPVTSSRRDRTARRRAFHRGCRPDGRLRDTGRDSRRDGRPSACPAGNGCTTRLASL